MSDFSSNDTLDLLDFLRGVRSGGRVLSAQHVYLEKDYSEIQHIHALTGKYPAIAELDLLDCHRYPDKKTRVLEFAKQWSKDGGILGLSWHQTSPELASLDEGGYRRGTRKKMSQARFNELLDEDAPLGQRYLAHLDLAAQWLMELRDAGVTVLWRPYHEMTGAWFWWGNKSPESYRALWIKMHDRLTRHHGLDNLIWVWSAAQRGKDFRSYLPVGHVDIAGVDIYRRRRRSPRFAALAKQVRDAAGDLPIALTEVGTLPAIDLLIEETDFIWFTIWGKGWLDREHYPRPFLNGPGNAPAWIRELYAHPAVITRDQLA